MTLNVSYTTDLEVKSERTQVDRAFFNRRFKALYDELSRLDTEMSSFGQTENTLIQIGLDRLNETLGPLLSTLQLASELGFLVCKSIGDNHSLVGGEFVGWHVTEGAALFTPTHFLLALDETDYTNWGLLSVDPDGWHATTGELSTHVVYSSKVKTSTQWQIAASAGVLPAMEDMLDDANAAKTATAADRVAVAADTATVVSLVGALGGGPVVSVAGRTGVVTLAEADVAGLVADLAARATITYVNAQDAGKQSSSAKLDALINLTWAANKLLYSTGSATLGTLDVSDFIKTLLDDANAGAAQTTLGISTFIKTLLDDVDAATARTTLGIAAAPDIPVKASFAEVAIGTDDVKFATAAGIALTYLPKVAGINTQTGTSYTFVDADNSKIVRFTSATAVTCLLPASAAVGFNAMIEQFGAGQVTINVVTNATRRAFGARYKLAGQYATCSIFCEANSDGNHAEWNLSGNLVA